MSVFFGSGESDLHIEVGEYQEFPKPEHEYAAVESSPKPKFRHLSLLLLSFGLLCVFQSTLNVALRLALDEPTNRGETEEVMCPEAPSCPEDWMMFGSSCYFISSRRRSWDDSRRDCMQREADLVVIESRLEQAFLTGFAAAAWVGMTDREKEGTWVWVDGTPVDKDRLQWATGQPDGAFGGEDCGDLRTMINFTGLNDLGCSVRNQWICEKTLL